VQNSITLAYVAAAILFVFGLKMLGSPRTARRGNLVSALGMALAVVATLLDPQIVAYRWIAAGVVVGTIIGAVAARMVTMTAMPQMVALFNGFGGIASLLVASWQYQRLTQLGLTAYVDSVNSGPVGAPALVVVVAMFLAVLIGGVTFSGSLVAYGKLDGRIRSEPVLFAGQRPLNALLLAAIVAGGVLFCLNPAARPGVFIAAAVLSLILGVMVVIPIGGADMPVVISLLNSYSGLAACAAGFIIQNDVLIVSGSLVGASGIILTGIMCKAMNRSLVNVLFSGFGAAQAAGQTVEGEARPISPDDAFIIIEAAHSVVFVPGYGMAVAQAQHAVRELGDLLKARGVDVRYVIHPVAGRMPGHMDVLLAEAGVAYEELVEMADANPSMPSVDVAIVVGANDTVNPAARDDESCSIYGMPIVEVDRARTVIVLKRSLRAGFSGVPNPLFYKPNVRLLFGDARASLRALVTEFKEA
jgi:NAD(P) transhydrogenase subunit beta